MKLQFMAKYESISRQALENSHDFAPKTFSSYKLLPFHSSCSALLWPGHVCQASLSLIIVSQMLPNNYSTFKVYLKKLMKIAANSKFLTEGDAFPSGKFLQRAI